jgi:putative ABC transport system permease protein
VSQYGLDKKPPMQIYLPHSQFPTTFNTIVVKTEGDPAAMTNSVRGAILSVDKDQAVFNVTTLEQLLGESIAKRKFFMLLLMIFAALALTLAAIGIYGSCPMSLRSGRMRSGFAWRSELREKMC